MNLYPAIDLKEGKCVRLLRGDMAAATVFGADPAAQAAEFEQAGFQWLHLVDLNGAIKGKPVNGDAVRSILERVTIPVQLGGGIRSMNQIDGWLSAGIRRVILGTVALRNPQLVKDACRAHPGRIAVGIDAKAGRVAVEGWVEESDVLALDLARKFEDAGVSAIIYTDIARDGAMQGPNLEETVKLARAISTPVILSGGMSQLSDVEAATKTGALEGIILGRALYEGKIDPAAALKAAA